MGKKCDCESQIKIFWKGEVGERFCFVCGGENLTSKATIKKTSSQKNGEIIYAPISTPLDVRLSDLVSRKKQNYPQKIL